MMTIEQLQAKRIGIIGFGKEGQAVARFLRRHGLQAFVFDEQSRSGFPEELIRELEGAGFAFQIGTPITDFSGVDIVFRSPGFHRLHPALRAAEAAGLVVTSQTKWFLEQCPAQVIGVTGTKGKGTTVSLIARCLEESIAQGGVVNHISPNAAVFVTGNIGKTDPLDLLDVLEPKDFVVFELSSFQLQDVTTSPHVAVCLMVTSEHLDHHKSLEEYHAAKAPIANYQKLDDVIIYAADYEISRRIGQLSRGAKYSYTRTSGGAYGATIQNEKDMIVFHGTPTEGSIDLQGRVLRGAHNLENMAAAALAAQAVGVSLSTITHALVTFPGLEHRLEYVRTVNGVTFYNDSFATTPESTMAAIAAFDDPKIVILGGSEKNSDFNNLAKCIADTVSVRSLIVIGVTAPRILQALQTAGYTGAYVTGAMTMNEIGKQILEVAQSGDVVLLSPACASFDMFPNYKERGAQFKAYVNSLTERLV